MNQITPSKKAAIKLPVSAPFSFFHYCSPRISLADYAAPDCDLVIL